MRIRLLVLFLVLSAASISAATDPVYTALRDARPDGRSMTLTAFTFDRDVYHFTLNGALHLLAPVNGTTVGAVFVGKGEYTLTPATDDERRSLSLPKRRREARYPFRSIRIGGVLRHGARQAGR